MFIGNINITEPMALALGVFDGIHKGHMEVISLATGNPYGLTPAVASFTPHPREVVSGYSSDCIISEDQRQEILQQIGVKNQVVFDFLAVKDMEPEEFFVKLISTLPIKMLCCGYNFRFGKNGKGDAELLKELCGENHIHFASAPEIKLNGVTISSSVIRNAIVNGDIKNAEDLLGRPLVYDLFVEDGDHRGRTIGFPTINQQLPEDMIKPRFGVYASLVFVENTWQVSVTNFGIRPTYLVKKPLFETFIIGYSGELYGKKIRLRLKKFIREETKFNSLAELKQAIENDRNIAISINSN